MSLIQEGIHAFKWSMFGEIASKAIGPLVFLVLARLLVPEDFGVVAAAMVIVSFSQIFSEAGLAKALIQRQSRVDESANVVFWLNLWIGLFIVAILLVIAPFIASFFHDERIAPVARVLSMKILLAAFSSVHTALLQRDLNFKKLFWVHLVTAGVPGLVSIPLAINGMGYWALVGGVLFGQGVQSVVLWHLSSWRPCWRVDRALAVELIAFGKWVMLSGLLGWFYLWMDAIVVGSYLGSHNMGLYHTGNALVTMIFGVIFSPLLPVLYSLFSRAQSDLQSLRKALSIVARMAALVALPIAFFLVTLGGHISGVLFGESWQGVGQIIGFLGLAQGVSWILVGNDTVYRAMGKPHIETWALALLLLVFLVGYLLSVQFGLQVFLVTRLGLTLFGFFVHIVIAHYVLRIPIATWFKGNILMVSAGAAVLTYLVGHYVGTSATDLILLGIVFVAVSVIGIAVFERSFLHSMIQLLRSKQEGDM